LIKSDHT